MKRLCKYFSGGGSFMKPVTQSAKGTFLSLLLTTCAVFTACTDEVENTVEEGKAPLSVNVGLSLMEDASRAIVDGTALPDASQIGLFLKDSKGNDYDGQDYNNLLYTIAGSSCATENAPLLSGTEGRVYAYYPYNPDVTDVTQIPVEAGETDYMYATNTSGIVLYSSPSASLNMNHVLAGIKIGIKKTNDLNEVKVSGVTVKSEGAAQGATMNAIDGTLSNFTGQGEDISSNTDLTVTTTTQYLPTFMVLPTGVKSKVKIDVTINGSQYTVSSSALTLLKGNIHEFVLSFNNIGEMSLTSVKVNGYTTSNNLEANIYPKSPSHGEVYAVNADGELISAELADETCIAAALVVGEHKFWIEKYEEKNEEWNGFHWLYWLKNYKDISEIPSIYGSETTNDGYGYLMRPNWTYPQSGMRISNDYKNWVQGPLSDFNGKTNTDYIVLNSSAQQDMGIVLKNFNTNEIAADRPGDWYIPSLGQLALIYMNMTELNTVLNVIGGTRFTTSSSNDTPYYNSSTELSSYSCWCIEMSSGKVRSRAKASSDDANGKCNVRFIRDIE